MDLGTRIRLWREARGLNQRDFAKQVGVTPSAVSYWESAACEPTHESVEKIADALGITVSRFWGEVPKARRVKGPKAKRAAA
jgi:transcriptional regulator with XRE-family HTH domain